MLFWNEPILKLWLFSPYLLQCTFRLPSANLSDTNTLLLCFIPVCPAEVPLLRDTLISFSCTLSTELFVKNHSQNISKAKERITVMESTIRDLEAMQEYLRIRFGKKIFMTNEYSWKRTQQDYEELNKETSKERLFANQTSLQCIYGDILNRDSQRTECPFYRKWQDLSKFNFFPDKNEKFKQCNL